jgi:hypothetical protein
MMYKMIKRNGKLFPWSEPLSTLQGAEVVEMTKKQIDVFNHVDVPPKPFKILHPIDLKPGPGWIRGHNGKWKMGVYKGHKGRHFAKDVKQGTGAQNESATNNRLHQISAQ